LPPFREFGRGPAFRILAYTLESGRSPVDEYLESLTARQRERIVARIREASRDGPPRNEERSKHIAGERFFEFKAGQERIFWCYGRRGELVLLHGFTKKRRKTPAQGLATARERYASVQAEIERRPR
jgi:phage-related protein